MGNLADSERAEVLKHHAKKSGEDHISWKVSHLSDQLKFENYKAVDVFSCYSGVTAKISTFCRDEPACLLDLPLPMMPSIVDPVE